MQHKQLPPPLGLCEEASKLERADEKVKSEQENASEEFCFVLSHQAITFRPQVATSDARPAACQAWPSELGELGLARL